MVTPELKWPITNFTPSPTNLLATDTPCLGSEASSPNTSSIFWPLMPPLALMSAAACSAPFFSCAPNAAFGPVSGPATPTLTCAEALPAAMTVAAAMASAGHNTFFIRGLPGFPCFRTLCAHVRTCARHTADDSTKVRQSHGQSDKPGTLQRGKTAC